MSRIRSVHPGFFTDENLVSCSAYARLLFIGLGVEADDKGIFEWKPLTIKMRIFPADSVLVDELLAELVTAGAIRRYEAEAKPYGAIKNFRKFQKPKTPNNIHPAPAEILAFVGLTSEPHGDNEGGFPPKGETFPQKGEKAPQMEEGGGREGENPPTPLPGEAREYAFEAKVIRLTRADHTDWRQRFHAIPDFDAELRTCDDWLLKQPESKREKWFGTAASWLSRRHQDHMARAGPQTVMASPC